MRPSRRLVGWAFLPVGTVAGHAAAYLLADRHPHGGVHGYLDVACWPTALAALGALAWFMGSRQSARWIPRKLPLAAAQVGLFLLQEAAEGLAEGRSLTAALWTPTVRYGVAIQVVLAIGIILVATLAAAGGACLRAALLDRSPRRQGRSVITRPASASRGEAGTLIASPASERGPPVLLVFG